jgi:hypothetical protein
LVVSAGLLVVSPLASPPLEVESPPVLVPVSPLEVVSPFVPASPLVVDPVVALPVVALPEESAPDFGSVLGSVAVFVAPSVVDPSVAAG